MGGGDVGDRKFIKIVYHISSPKLLRLTTYSKIILILSRKEFLKITTCHRDFSSPLSVVYPLVKTVLFFTKNTLPLGVVKLRG